MFFTCVLATIFFSTIDHRPSDLALLGSRWTVPLIPATVSIFVSVPVYLSVARELGGHLKDNLQGIAIKGATALCHNHGFGKLRG